MPSSIGVRKLAVLLLLNAPDSHGHEGRPIQGMTRLQKLLFLVWKDLGHVSSDRELEVDFSFEPERFGPADTKLYADLDLLTALKHVDRSDGDSDSSSQLSIEEATEDDLSFDYLMGDEEVARDYAGVEKTEVTFRITESGIQLLKRLEAGMSGRSLELFKRLSKTAADIRKQYGDWPLEKLLRFVYSKYPDMTTSSEIRGRVLGKY
jgi:hypothetical protein